MVLLSIATMNSFIEAQASAKESEIVELSKEYHLLVFHTLDFENNWVSTFEMTPPIIENIKLFNIIIMF